ncbi:MAG: AraC family transcriptional regulator [Oceanospirillales bacterium]|nr:AraC family transcriptional regulator [Oceanospirillales bacterium]MBR9889888.1 AraC family transcriptional regulator [Oceanospirillales bacterium]
MHLAKSYSIVGYQRLVTELGQNPVALVRSVGFLPSQFNGADLFVSYNKLAELLELTAIKCRQPLFGLLLTQHQPLEALGPLPLFAAQSQTIGDALTKVSSALYLQASGVHVRQISAGDNTQVVLDFDISTPLGITQMKLLSVGHLCNFLAEITGLPRYEFEISVSAPAPHLSDYGNSEYTQVHFDQPFCGITLRTQQLNCQNRQYASAISTSSKRYVEFLRAQFPTSLEEQVRQVASALLASGDCSLEHVAASLDLHPRMLQLKLRKLDVSYTQIMRSIRQTLAEDHLRRKTMSVTDLALNLGYADASIFSTQFKAWTGLSPKQWQKTFCSDMV